MVKILSKNKNIKVLDPNWFYVGEAEGPLLDDEIQKAKNNINNFDISWFLFFYKLGLY